MFPFPRSIYPPEPEKCPFCWNDKCARQARKDAKKLAKSAAKLKAEKNTMRKEVAKLMRENKRLQARVVELREELEESYTQENARRAAREYLRKNREAIAREEASATPPTCGCGGNCRVEPVPAIDKLPPIEESDEVRLAREEADTDRMRKFWQ